ncbi:tripartite motif-containing protein 2-like [Lingula anatina]|uniref:Tripartite motif-containing protein 2-like n=1 Tax=Lingula anatina TaxID=7574 RepID=A0A1S3IWH3_LINAN|nr:tripartite motif-containing protein 2-like [Lingula anatina]|eukprot:XP_013402316.1 tripartite motif-containing protein 2-like [Lingula anatina]
MAEALAADIEENILTCSICLGKYEDPHVLPCHHTFCYGCICDHAKRNLTPNRTFLCPICKEQVQFPDGGLTQLKKNFSFCRTKEIKAQERARWTLEEEQVNVAAVAQAIAQMAISCEKHANKELKYYCEDDDTVICGQCIATEHGGHRISAVDTVAKSKREEIKAALDKMMKMDNKFKKALAMGTANETEDSYIMTVTINNIKEQAQSMHKFIDQREETLISEVNSAYNIRKKQKEAKKNILESHHDSLHSACDFAQQLLTNGTNSDIMVHAKSLIERLAMIDKTPVPTPDTPAQISYSPGKISTAGLEAMLGQVMVPSQPSLAGQETNPRSPPYPPVFLEKAKCVHSFSTKLVYDRANDINGLAIDDEQIFVVDNGAESTKIFTDVGGFKYGIKINRVSDIAVSQTGHLYITSWGDKCVKVYSNRGRQVTTMGQDQLEMPLGITLNRQGDVMVCDKRRKSIFTFHADSGQLLNTIPLSMSGSPQNITVNSVNDNIVISDPGWNKHCVHVLSPTGDQLYQYGSGGSGDGQLMSPQGVCTDSYGHIFIADCLNHRIVALSPQGQFIRYIATMVDELKRPTALAMNPIGHLVVAEAEGQIKTFQCFQ